MLFVDVDYFKGFNDTYGHAAGDEVLAAVAECIDSVVRRPVDLVALRRRGAAKSAGRNRVKS